MGVAGCPGITGRIKSVRVAGYYRYRWPDHPGIRTDLHKPPEVALGADVLRQKPTGLPRAHPREQTKKKGAVKYPVICVEEERDLIVTQDPVGSDLGLVSDQKPLPRVSLKTPRPNTPVQELLLLSPDPPLGLGSQG